MEKVLKSPEYAQALAGARLENKVYRAQLAAEKEYAVPKVTKVGTGKNAEYVVTGGEGVIGGSGQGGTPTMNFGGLGLGGAGLAAMSGATTRSGRGMEFMSGASKYGTGQGMAVMSGATKGSQGSGFQMMTGGQPQGSGFQNMVAGLTPRGAMSSQSMDSKAIALLGKTKFSNEPTPQTFQQQSYAQPTQVAPPGQAIVSPYSGRPVTYTRGPYKKREVVVVQQQ